MIVARNVFRGWVKSGRVRMTTGVTSNGRQYIAGDDLKLQRVVHMIATQKDIDEHPELFS